MNPIQLHLSQVSEAISLLDQDKIAQVVSIIRIVKQGGGTMYLFGNGGSHATASHFANDLMKMVKVRAVCIGDMTASILAYGNDLGWDGMFRNTLHKMINMKGGKDGVVGISCGGNSENVIEGLRYAVEMKKLSVGLTGQSNESGINKVGLDALVHVRADDIRVQEDCHLMICHAVVRALQEE